MEFEEFQELLKYIYEQIDDEKLWDLYLVNFSHMDKSNYESFSEYKNRVKNNNFNNDIASVEEVMEELKEVMAAFGKEVK